MRWCSTSETDIRRHATTVTCTRNMGRRRRSPKWKGSKREEFRRSGIPVSSSTSPIDFVLRQEFTVSGPNGWRWKKRRRPLAATAHKTHCSYTLCRFSHIIIMRKVYSTILPTKCRQYVMFMFDSYLFHSSSSICARHTMHKPKNTH